MKKIYLSLLCMIIALSSFSQSAVSQRVDVIKKSNGEELKGKIIKVTDAEVSFVYSGETAEYIIKKSDISQITHSSGRVEIISQQVSPSDRKSVV